MLKAFSVNTAALLKTLSFLEALNWSGENQNILDLTSIKRIKGCRTILVQDSLILIQKLDKLAEKSAEDRIKSYVSRKMKELIENLKRYNVSCERYPRIKDFLNIITDNIGEMVVFMIIASVGASIAFPPLAVIPLFIFSWVLMDLFFNNRDEAKNLHNLLHSILDELTTLEKADIILNPEIHAAQNAIPTQPSRLTPEPSTSRNCKNYAPNFHGSIEDGQVNTEKSSINSSTSPRFT